MKRITLIMLLLTGSFGTVAKIKEVKSSYFDKQWFAFFSYQNHSINSELKQSVEYDFDKDGIKDTVKLLKEGDGIQIQYRLSTSNKHWIKSKIWYGKAEDSKLSLSASGNEIQLYTDWTSYITKVTFHYDSISRQFEIALIEKNISEDQPEDNWTYDLKRGKFKGWFILNPSDKNAIKKLPVLNKRVQIRRYFLVQYGDDMLDYMTGLADEARQEALTSYYLPNDLTLQTNSFLVSKAIKEIGVVFDKVKFDLVRTKILPNDNSKTIVCIPVVIKEEDDGQYILLDAHVLIMNTKNGKILQYYKEEEYWQSDAITLQDIIVDTAPYRLNNNTRAFGIVSGYRGNSAPNPYSSSKTSLFYPKGKTLVKVLDNFTTSLYKGETDMRCDGRFEHENSVIIISGYKTNGYADLIINQKTIYSETTKKGEDCDEKVIKSIIKKTTLRFNKGTYPYKSLE